MEGMPRYFANEGESRPSKIVDNRSCEMCKQGDESVFHVLWECGIAQDVWAGSKLHVYAEMHNIQNGFP